MELDSITGRIAKQPYPKADITIAGFQTTDRRDFYDIAVGNVPFGQYSVNDRAYNKLNFTIHNYFFAKSLDQVRPGGIVAFVTSRYTMDSKPHQAVTSVDTASEALAVSIAEKAEVDMAYMAELSGKTQEELALELRGVIFRLPVPLAEGETPRYVTADEYLSGNVRRKLRQAQRAADKDPAFSVNVEALTAAQPKDLDASEIEVRLGATWIDKDYIKRVEKMTG